MNRRIKQMKNRIYAWVLVIATLIVSLPITALPAFSEDDVAAEPIVITRDGEEIEALSLREDAKITLCAKSAKTDGVYYRWQIRDVKNSERWINIYGAAAKELDVSYALIGSMLDKNGVAAIRCQLIDGETKYDSKPVTVTVSYNVPDSSVEAPVGTLVGVDGIDVMNDADGDRDTYTIVINYLFDNNAMAFEPYGASVAKGSDFSASITSPTVVGYAPYRRIGENYVPANTVELNYTDIQSDITVNVIYEPALVNFSVHHHLQNLLDDEYSVHYDLITNGQALTETIVPEGLALTEAQLPGFKALAYERLAVAADGSTVVEIRYDRNYYLVDFDMMGGLWR